MIHPPPSHDKSKSALLAASSTEAISLSCFERKCIASVLDLLPLEEGLALMAIRGSGGQTVGSEGIIIIIIII